jgi:hypothetical protein
MNISAHAKQRGQQRAISDTHMALVSIFGKPIRVKGGAISYQLDKHGLRELEAVLREGVQLIDKLKSTKVICSDDDNDQVITCYHVA